jgi:hypothetical protein
MASLFRKLQNLVTHLTHREPLRRAHSEAGDWLPPVVGSCDLASPYFLAMADRDSGWYVDRR